MEEEKSQALFTKYSARYVDTTQNWAAAALQPLSGTSLKGSSGEGESSQWAELQQCHLVVHCAWKEKWSHEQLYTDSCAVANNLAGWTQLRRNMIGKMRTKKSGKEVYG